MRIDFSAFRAKWAQRGGQKQRAEFCTRLMEHAVTAAEVQAVHHIKLDLDLEFEGRLRSLQTLLETQYVPAYGLAFQEVIRRTREQSYRDVDHLMNILSHHTPPERWG